MDVSKYKPGRRLDAMVAMCLGWRWKLLWEEGVVSVRTLYPRGDDADGDNASRNDRIAMQWATYLDSFAPSTNPGIAFEAALEAGVLELRSIGQYEQSGVDFFEIDDGDIGVLAMGDTAAHCLCLGILAIQPEDKLAEWESWLEGIE